jgi:hypothetical protein
MCLVVTRFRNGMFAGLQYCWCKAYFLNTDDAREQSRLSFACTESSLHTQGWPAAGVPDVGSVQSDLQGSMRVFVLLEVQAATYCKVRRFLIYRMILQMQGLKARHSVHAWLTFLCSHPHVT